MSVGLAVIVENGQAILYIKNIGGEQVYESGSEYGFVLAS